MIGKKSIVSLLSVATLASCTTPGNTTLETPKTPEVAAPTPTAEAPATVTSTPATPSEAVQTKEISYQSPAGPESMKVSITTKDGVITSVTATPLATNPISLKLQTAFADGVSKSVVGKAVKGLKVDTVSGASLTTGAFNAYIASIN